MGLTITQTTNDAPINAIIKLNWLLLYTCSTISSINNEYLVKDIHVCDAGEELWDHTNGGHQDYNYISTMKMLHLEVFTKLIP